MNPWLLGVVWWLAIGITAVGWCVYDDWDEGKDFTLADLGMVFATILTGPIFAIWYIKEKLKEAGDIVLFKGKKKNDD